MQLILFVLQKMYIPASLIGLVHVLLLQDIYYAQITFLCSTYIWITLVGQPRDICRSVRVNVPNISLNAKKLLYN